MNRKTPLKLLFEDSLIILGTTLTCKLPNISSQEHQDVDGSSTGGESITPKLHTNTVGGDKTPGGFEDDYIVRLRDEVTIIIERNVATQT